MDNAVTVEPCDAALAIGQNAPEVNDRTGRLPASGDYTVSVVLMRSAARRDERPDFTIDKSVTTDPGAQVEDGQARQAPASVSTSLRVAFVAGATGAELTGSLPPGKTRRDVLGAASGQNLHVRVVPQGAPVGWRIFNPDQPLLPGQMTSNHKDRGELWQSGDHIVAVINRRASMASYTIIMGMG